MHPPTGYETSHLAGALVSRYEAVVCDLDGVVYRGHQPIDHAVQTLERIGELGVRVVYGTNNASRPPQEVAGQLRALGLSLTDQAVVTSSQAGAVVLAQQLPAGSRVLAVGGPGVSLALDDAGLTPLRVRLGPDGTAEPVQGAVAVLQGYGRDVSWHDLAEAAYAVAAGARWVATNDDATLPTSRGFAPGNGALVAAVRTAVAVDPLVVGKPHPPIYRLAAQAAGATVGRTLAIGDRLDTDIAGARATGMDSLHVLTGVHGLRDLCLAPTAMRPTYVGWDLRVLFSAAAEVTEVGRGRWQSGEAELTWDVGVEPRMPGGGDSATGTDGRVPTVQVRGGTAQDRLRVVVAAAWWACDRGRAAEVSRLDWVGLAGQMQHGGVGVEQGWPP